MFNNFLWISKKSFNSPHFCHYMSNLTQIILVVIALINLKSKRKVSAINCLRGAGLQLNEGLFIYRNDLTLLYIQQTCPFGKFIVFTTSTFALIFVPPPLEV